MLSSTRTSFFSFDLLAELRNNNSALKKRIAQLERNVEKLQEENGRLVLLAQDDERFERIQSEIAAQFEEDLCATPTKRAKCDLWDSNE